MLIMVKRPGLRSFFFGLQQREDMASSARIQEPEIIEPNTLKKNSKSNQPLRPFAWTLVLMTMITLFFFAYPE